VLFANFYLATVLYPVLTSYNGQIPAAQYVNQHNYSNIYSGRMESNVFQFECNNPVTFLPVEKFKDMNAPGSVMYVTQYLLNYLNNNHIPYHLLKSFTHYPQERILPAFVNTDTREKVLEKVYLISR